MHIYIDMYAYIYGFYPHMLHMVHDIHLLNWDANPSSQHAITIMVLKTIHSQGKHAQEPFHFQSEKEPKWKTMLGGLVNLQHFQQDTPQGPRG